MFGTRSSRSAPTKVRGGDEDDVTHPAEAPPLVARGHLVGKAVEHHGGPTGVAAPAASEQKRPEDFGYQVVDDSAFEHAEEKVVPKAGDLHVLALDEPEIAEHVKPHGE